MLMNEAELGELGWGFRSIGRGLKKAGKGAYKVGKLAAKSSYKVGKVGYKVAALPAKAALKVANAAQKALCAGGGVAATAAGGPAGAAFCAAMRAKDGIRVRQLLPAAVTAAAAQAAQTQQVYSSVKTAYQNPEDAIVASIAPAESGTAGAYDASELWGLSDADVNLLASLDGADSDELAFALAGVDPGEIGAVMTKADLVTLAPMTLAVAVGFWMLFRG